MSLLHNPHVFRYLSRWIICGVETEERVCALTFDDGPSKRNTPRFLDQLERQGVRATFFVLGKHAERLPRLLRRMADAGHEIGNHSYHHLYLNLCPEWLMRREIQRASAVIESIIGTSPKLLRPPGGWFSQRVVRIVEQLGYHMVLGDVYPSDPQRPGVERIVRSITERTQPGSIVILHDSSAWGDLDRSQTLNAVEEFVPMLRERGFSFVTVSELIDRGAVLRPEGLDRVTGQ